MDTDIAELYKSVLDSELSKDEKKEFFDEIRKLKPATEQRGNIRWVISALVFVAISSPLLLIILGFQISDPKLPPELLTLSSTAVGALAAFMTSSFKK